jgi:hypothetical protein
MPTILPIAAEGAGEHTSCKQKSAPEGRSFRFIRELF